MGEGVLGMIGIKKEAKKPEIIAFLMHLGTNNWQNKGHNARSYLDNEDFVYRDELNCDKETWRKVTEFLPSCGINTLVIDVADGVVYDKHPEISIPGAWTKAELKEDLDRLRAMGITPIPKCNFSCCHDAWLKEYSKMVGTDIYNEVCKDVIEELIELFDNPEFFHLGLEEEDYNSQMGTPFAIVRDCIDRLEGANRLFDICRAHGVRPWIWVDAKSIDGLGGDEMFKKYIGKDVLLSNFYYGSLRFHSQMCEKSEFASYCCKFDEWGYEQIPTGSTWSWHLSNKDIVRFSKNFLSEKTLKGYMSASWMLTTKRKFYALMNDAANLGFAVEDIYAEPMLDKNINLLATAEKKLSK